MDTGSRDNRTYTSTKLPTLREGVDVFDNRDLMLKMYDQACQAWRELVGVRFRLLAIVPSVSLLLLATILSSEGPGKGLAVGLKILLGTLGLIVTVGLLIYDLRNSMIDEETFRGVYAYRLKQHCRERHYPTRKTDAPSGRLATIPCALKANESGRQAIQRCRLG